MATVVLLGNSGSGRRRIIQMISCFILLFLSYHVCILVFLANQSSSDPGLITP